VAWSTPDLSAITADLIAMIQSAIIASPIPPFNVTVSGSMPQTVRHGDADCQLSIYLLHVGRDPYWRNSPRDSGTLATKQQALSLNLTYLLTAFAHKDFVAEQQAMSIALHCFHEQPLHHTATEEYTISIEADTIDEMSRLWQAIVAPIRLSAVIKVGVIFVSPSEPPPTVSPPPRQANVAVGADLQPGVVPQLFSIVTPITFIVPPIQPNQPPPPPEQVGAIPGPTVVTGGDTIVVGGSGLDQANATDVYLGRLPGGPIWKVTNPWRPPPPSPPDKVSSNEIVLTLPSAYMAPGTSTPTPPALMPPPGVYQLMVGGAAPVVATAIPIAIAARVSGLTSPPALVPDATGLYTVTGEGFTPGSTAVALDIVGLAPASAPDPAAGSFFIDAAGQTIVFRRPVLQPGRYFLRIRVSSVECPPSWWVDVP
jgi:hypothetical protein